MSLTEIQARAAPRDGSGESGKDSGSSCSMSPIISAAFDKLLSDHREEIGSKSKSAEIFLSLFPGCHVVKREGVSCR